MLSSLYGDLPPPSASNGASGGDSSSFYVQQPIAEPPPSAAPPFTPQTNDDTARVLTADPLAATWSTKLFIPPTLRSRKDVNKNSTTTTQSSGPSKKQSVAAATDPPGDSTTQVLSVDGSKPSSKLVKQGDHSGSPNILVRDINQDEDEDVLYDPARPNSYEEVRRERGRKKLQQEMEKQYQETKVPEPVKATGPSSLARNVTGEEAWRRRAMLSQNPTMPTDSIPTATPTPATTTSSGKKAIRMMEQMGWKSGEGLGREKQGIVEPLVARKTDKKGGVIVHGRQVPMTPSTRTGQTPVEATSRIVMLKNLVAPEEVNDELKEEIFEEASKCGNLLNVVIHEEGDLPPQEAVKVFLEYESKSDAAVALSTFHGRLFDNHVVQCSFYDEDAYLMKSPSQAA